MFSSITWSWGVNWASVARRRLRFSEEDRGKMYEYWSKNLQLKNHPAEQTTLNGSGIALNLPGYMHRISNPCLMFFTSMPYFQIDSFD